MTINDVFALVRDARIEDREHDASAILAEVSPDFKIVNTGLDLRFKYKYDDFVRYYTPAALRRFENLRPFAWTGVGTLKVTIFHDVHPETDSPGPEQFDQDGTRLQTNQIKVGNKTFTWTQPRPPSVNE